MSHGKNVVTVEFELILSHLGPIPTKLANAQIQWKWRKGREPKDSGTSSKSTLPEELPSYGVLMSLPVTFKTRLQQQSGKFEKKILACSIKCVRRRHFVIRFLGNFEGNFLSFAFQRFCWLRGGIFYETFEEVDLNH
jgi:hypothetical protein